MGEVVSIRLVKKLITEKTERAFWPTQIHKVESIQPFKNEEIPQKLYTHTHTHTHTYIKEEILSFLTTWMEFEGIKLREVCHRKTNTDLTCAFFKKKKLRKRSDLWFTRGMGVRGVVKRYKLPGITLISSGGTRYNMTTALTAVL